jgi:replication factor C subunit 1
MDEVDGVGAGDRGGIQALIQVIKNSKTPIICICNDRMNKKLQSLLGYCYDLKFQRPSKEAIMSRIKLICED